MTDHVSATLIIHALPRQHARAVMDLIEEQSLTDGADDAETGVLLGVPYVAHDWASGALEAIEFVMSRIPNAAWTAWYDAYAGDLGELRRYVPGLGMFSCCSDSDGRPQFSDEQIRAAIDEGRNQRVLVDIHYLYELIGQKWHDAIQAMSQVSKPRVVPPVIYDVLWDTRAGDVEIEPASGGNEIELQGPRRGRRPGRAADSDVWQAASATAIRDFLIESGWQVAGPWDYAARGRMWTTTAYRTAELTEVSA